MEKSVIRALLDEEATRLAPTAPDLWPRLSQTLVAQSRAERPRHAWSGLVASPLARSIAIALAVGVAAVGLWTAPVVGAQLQRLACFVPSLGIRACAEPGLVSAHPVSIRRGGSTLTITHVLSSSEGTNVGAQLVLTGPDVTPENVRSAALQSTLALIGPNGHVRTGQRVMEAPWAVGGPPSASEALPRASGLAVDQWQMVSSGGGTTPGAPQTVSFEFTFAPLPAGTTRVQVRVAGPAPVGAWQVSVPLVSAEQAGLSTARSTATSATVHGITVRVANVVADHERTALELVGTATPPVRFVRQLGGSDHLHRQLVLRDDQGHTYVEIPSPGRTYPDQGGVHTEDAIFPPLAAGVHQITLDLPFVIVTEESESASLMVPLAGKRVGDAIPLQVDLPFGQEHLRVTAAIIVAQQGERWLKLSLAPTDWKDGRKLVGPDRVLVDGQSSGFQAGFDPVDVGQWTSLAVQLPATATDQVTIIFEYPDVAIAGPWHLVVPIPPY